MKIKYLKSILTLTCLCIFLLIFCNTCVETKATPSESIEFNSPAEILIEINCKAVIGEASSSCCISIKPIFLYIERTITGVRVTEKSGYIKRIEIIKP